MRKQAILSTVSVRSFICVLLIVTGISSLSSVRVNATTVSYDPQSYSALTPHASISITSDVELEVFPGSGTTEDPYVIEGYNITTTDDSGIYITGTTKYFTVRNCYVDASTNGIYIKSIAYSSASVINNSCWNNLWGILLQSSGGSSVVNNTCNDNNWYGIQLQSSSGSSVVNNTCNNSGVGIAFNGCGSSSIINNTATNCGYSISEGNGAGYLSYIIENNSVNGKELGIYVYLDSTIIDEQIYGQLILIECSNVTVRNQILDNAGTSIYLRYCANTIITNNTCNNNIEFGITDWYSINTSISSNTWTNNGNGIYLFNSVYSYIRDNLCS
ncbi:MAG: right-handed parallel beta-helix repeat-containing protein, partial [Candidatus Heimdallarchaeaceae archaeon]